MFFLEYQNKYCYLILFLFLLDLILIKNCQNVKGSIIILIDSFILLMTTKLERHQKLKPLKQPRQNSDYNPSSFPQQAIQSTQIPISPNPSSRLTHNEQFSSRDIDNWNLNNNLKQFGETRQVGFFKNKKQNQRHKSNPYIIHKVRTPDFRTLDRDRQSKIMEQTQGNFKKDAVHSHITIDQDKITKLLLENVLAKPEKTKTAKFYPSSKGNSKIQIKKDIEDVYRIQQICRNPMKTTTKSFRKNRFMLPNYNQATSIQKIPQQIQQYVIKPPQLCQQPQQDAQQHNVQQKFKAPRIISIEMRRKSFNKAIESINKQFLLQTDSYFDHTFLNPSPQPQVELFVNTISQQHERPKSLNYRSSHPSSIFGEYDFQFKQQSPTPFKSSKRNSKIKLTQ